MHFKHLILLSLFLCVPFLGKAQTDLETKAKNQNSSKLDRSATDYVLQRPRVTKRFKQKKFGDHLFAEGAGGITLVPQRVTRAKTMPPSVIGNVSVGDWVSPEHGWRVSVTPAFYKVYDTKLKTISFSADYMMNFSAIAYYKYNERKPFEMFGIAGFKYMATYFDGKYRKGLGFHLGLRGQYNFSKLTYIYLEPQVEMFRDKTMLIVNDMHFRPVGNFLAGVGYNLLTKPERSTDKSSYSDFFHDGTFFSLGIGPSTMAGSQLYMFKRNVGMHAQMSVGKWFDPYNALRLSAHTSVYKGYPRRGELLRGIGGRVDYMLNLHNLFGGPRQDRRFWVNALAGASYSYMKEKGDHRNRWGLGAGLQGNLRVSKNADLFLEPRVDIYGNEYIKHSSTTAKWDVMPTVLAGVAFHNSTDVSKRRENNATFQTDHWTSHFFLEAAGGVTMPAKPKSVKHPDDYVGPKAFVGLGKWFAPTVGARVWAEAGQMKQQPNRSSKFMGMGADFLWNITNTFRGYKEDRPCELIAGIGISGSTLANQKHLYFGGNASLKGLWHVTRLFGLYLEPQLRINPDNYLKQSGSSANLDFPVALMLGAQLDLTGGYDRAKAREAFDEEGKGTFVSLGLGSGVQANNMRTWDYYGWQGQFAFGRWFSPTSAWRTTLSGLKKNYGRHRHYAEIMLGADYMADLTAMTYGYRKDRPVRLIGFLGGALGADYMYGGKSTFSPNLHFGGQFAVRAGSQAEIFLEPQLAYKMGTRYQSRLDHWHPSLLLGVTYNMKASEGKTARSEKPKYRQFVNIGLGSGYHTLTSTVMQPRNRKITFEAGVGYGRWWNEISGWHVALHNSTLQTYGKGNRNITALQANYLIDLIAPFSCKKADERVFQLTGTLGAGLYINSRKNEDTRFAPGVQAALQIGARVAQNVDLYLEPAADVYSSKILKRSTSHPAEGEVRLQLGTRIHF